MRRGLSRRNFLAGVGAVAVVACGAPGAPPTAATKPRYGGTITFVLENDVIDLDPLRSRARVDRNVHYQIYDSLVKIDAKGTILPGLAESWKVSDDGKSLILSLRSGVNYHDGTPFDAESVKWNIDRYRTTKGSQRSGELASVTSVDVLDRGMVRLNLKAPTAQLLAALVDRAGMMVSRKVFESAGEDFTRKAFRAGTGPFVLTEAVKDDHYTLERNPSYWGKDADGSALPYLDRVVVKPVTDGTVRLTNVRTGAAHVANNVPQKDVASLRSDSTLSYQEVAGLAYDSMIPNRSKGFVLEDSRNVKAIAMALDRAEILQKVFFGIGTIGYGAIAPPHFAYDPAFKPFERADPDGARKLVADVGKGPLRVELLVRTGEPQELQLAQLIQAQLAKADIRAELRTLEFAQILKAQTEHTFPGLSLVGWSGRIDPDGNVYDHISTGRPNNDGVYSNPEVDRLLEEQRSATDESKRRAALRRAEQIYAVEDPARVWYRFGVAPLVTLRDLKGLLPYPDSIIRFQFGWLQR